MKRIAVFVRNHREYLEAACATAEKAASNQITFRSAVRWSAVEKALNEQPKVTVYLAPVGKEGSIEYVARLETLVLDPKRGDKTTEAYLALAPEGTTGEGLWESDAGSVKTLYVISRCKRVKKPFPISSLCKASDGKPISDGYSYAYVPVLERADDAQYVMSPEEIGPAEVYSEGTVRTALVNAYERNVEARNKCLKHYGVSCSVCHFDFGAKYGEIGAGFIHVHHLKLLSSIKGAYQVDPINDLKPVCPNCHAMLHKRNPPYSVDELSELMTAQS